MHLPIRCQSGPTFRITLLRLPLPCIRFHSSKHAHTLLGYKHLPVDAEVLPADAGINGLDAGVAKPIENTDSDRGVKPGEPKPE